MIRSPIDLHGRRLRRSIDEGGGGKCVRGRESNWQKLKECRFGVQAGVSKDGQGGILKKRSG